MIKTISQLTCSLYNKQTISSACNWYWLSYSDPIIYKTRSKTPASCSDQSTWSCKLASLSDLRSVSGLTGTCKTLRIRTKIRSISRPSSSLRSLESCKFDLNNFFWISFFFPIFFIVLKNHFMVCLLFIYSSNMRQSRQQLNLFCFNNLFIEPRIGE